MPIIVTSPKNDKSSFLSASTHIALQPPYLLISATIKSERTLAITKANSLKGYSCADPWDSVVLRFPRTQVSIRSQERVEVPPHCTLYDYDNYEPYPIEPLWCHSKKHTRDHCNGTITRLRKIAPESLSLITKEDFLPSFMTMKFHTKIVIPEVAYQDCHSRHNGYDREVLQVTSESNRDILDLMLKLITFIIFCAFYLMQAIHASDSPTFTKHVHHFIFTFGSFHCHHKEKISHIFKITDFSFAACELGQFNLNCKTKEPQSVAMVLFIADLTEVEDWSSKDSELEQSPIHHS